MRDIILALIILCAAASASAHSAPSNPPKVNLKELQMVTHNTGCIDGFLVIYEMGAYVRPAHLKTAREAFEEIKRRCYQKTLTYLDEMGHNDGSREK